MITFRDISKQMEYEEQIRRSAFYDDLTELPNRTLFINRLERSIKRRKRGANQQFAVAFLDLDGFAAINEGLGHEVGDEVLMEISSRITQTIRPDDTISRFSSKVFAVLFDPIDSAAGGIQACECIQRAVDKPIEIGSKVLNVSASAGILVNQDVYETAEEMVRDADTALHRAKSQAVGSYAIFNNEMYESALQFLERKSSMQQALEDGDFEVYYQPIIDVATEQ
ncbi:MAG TPA: diguanylate cyclase, partial [Dehalococcoidia bacterium]|nr:diguanylate cyclase [Dehalococcoidia bacterium]